MTPARGALFRSGLLALPLAFAGLPLYIHAPDLYAAQLGVPLASIGLVLLALRLIDAVQDPLIGALSDRYHAHRRHIVCLGLVLLAAGFIMVFHPLASAPLVWLALSVLICTFGYSIASINLQAIGGLWNVAPEQRGHVASWREALGLCGLLAASVTPALLTQQFEPLHAFHFLSLGFIPLLVVCGWVFMRWLRSASLAAPEAGEPLPFRTLLRERWVRRFVLVYGLSTLASSIPGVLVLFFIRDHLGAEAQTGLFLLLYFLSGALAMPLWNRLAARRGKRIAWCISMGLACATFVWAFLLPPSAITAFAIICILSGTALGADLALPPAMIADRIHRAQHARAATRYYSLLAFLSKAALALATGLTLPALGWAGYQPGAADTTGLLPIAYALIPCLMKAVAGLLLYHSSTLDQEYAHADHQLDTRRQ